MPLTITVQGCHMLQVEVSQFPALSQLTLADGSVQWEDGGVAIS